MLNCAENQHILYHTANDTHNECICACDEGFKEDDTVVVRAPGKLNKKYSVCPEKLLSKNVQ